MTLRCSFCRSLAFLYRSLNLTVASGVRTHLSPSHVRPGPSYWPNGYSISCSMTSTSVTFRQSPRWFLVSQAPVHWMMALQALSLRFSGSVVRFLSSQQRTVALSILTLRPLGVRALHRALAPGWSVVFPCPDYFKFSLVGFGHESYAAGLGSIVGRGLEDDARPPPL